MTQTEHLVRAARSGYGRGDNKAKVRRNARAVAKGVKRIANVYKPTLPSPTL